MKSFLIGSVCLLAAAQSQAFNERDASKLVKKFSETVACEIAPDDKNQYKAVKVAEGDSELSGMGSAYVVFWYGDIGCMGGSGTIGPRFTVVEQIGSSSPLVNLDAKIPDMDLAVLTSLTGKNGILNIKGLTYGPNDSRADPRKPVLYRLKYVDGQFVKQ